MTALYCSATDLARRIRDKQIGARELCDEYLARIDAVNLESTGGFWHAEGYELPW